MKHALIAMSGGVDSTVAAALMKEAGYDCTGVTMRLYREQGFTVKTGVFAAEMQVLSQNDGPVTILLDTKEL